MTIEELEDRVKEASLEVDELLKRKRALATGKPVLTWD